MLRVSQSKLTSLDVGAEEILRRRVLYCCIAASWLFGGIEGAVTSQPSQARTVFEGVYTMSQAERGKAAYERECAACHRSDLSGESFAPPLIEEAFTKRWQNRTLDELFIIVKQTMPQDKPASLSDREYSDIVAYLLRANRFPVGSQELSADSATLKKLTFGPRTAK